MHMSYEFDAPQFIDFTNLENEEDESEKFFKNYVCPSSVKVKKKRLKLDNNDSTKPQAQVSTPVNRRCQRSFIGLSKYKTTPHPRGRSLKRLSTSNYHLPRFVDLDSKSLRKLRLKVPMEAVVKEVKKKRLRLNNVDSSKAQAQVSTPVNRRGRRSFGGVRKYKSTPHPKGRGLKRLSTSNDLPRFVGLSSKSLRKLRPKVPMEAVVKICKSGGDIDKVFKDPTTVKAPLTKVKELNGICKKSNDETKDDKKSSKRPLSQSRLAPKLPQAIKSEKVVKSTVPKPFKFATETRSSSRRQFEEKMLEKRIADEEKKNCMKELKAVRDKKDLVQFRKTLVHKPKPVKVGKPFEMKPHIKKPTIPVSPKLGVSRQLP